METILDKIVARIKLDEAEVFKNYTAVSPVPVRKPIDVKKLASEHFFLICEIKKASPSKGLIREDFDPVSLAKDYALGGASGLSILTEKNFFLGAKSFLKEVRGVSNLPLLRKDFVIHPSQVDEAYALGADMVLLIAACLTDELMKTLHERINAWGMSALVEVHDEQELERVLKINPDLIGINNRNLKTFEVDLETSFRLKKNIPSHIPVIAESGIENNAHIEQLKEGGFAGALVGESLLRKSDVVSAVKNLLGNR
jgi:indole-3-glycerol phosphate synthase